MDKSDHFFFFGFVRVLRSIYSFWFSFLFVELVAWYSLFSEACCEVAILLIHFLFSIFPRKVPFWCQIRRFEGLLKECVL